MKDFCSEKKYRLIETSPASDLGFNFQNYFLQSTYEVLKNTLNNAFWYLEGEDSNLILFHFFSNPDSEEVESAFCNFGSDIFDCLKLDPDLHLLSTGGYFIEDKSRRKIINPVLDNFKKNTADKIIQMYREKAEFKHYRIDIRQLMNAMDLEFQAEANYQNVIDTIFDKLGITTGLKFFIDQFRDTSKDIEKGRLQEYNYLPDVPNFAPLINDSVFKFFGISTTIPIEDYYISKEDIEYYKIKEKEVNWIYAENASFCGVWNALIDTVDGLVLLIPSLYEILTDRAMFKKFFHLILELVHNFPKLKDMLTQYDLENSSGSIYRFNYQQCYELMMIITLLLPIPKAGKAGKASEVLEVFSQWLAKFSEKADVVLLAYKLGLRVEKTADEWAIVFGEVKIFKGTKEKVMQRIEHITEVAKENPKFVMRNLSLGRLEALVDVKKGLGNFLKGLSKEERVIIQSELYSANIAVAKFKISYKGKTVFLDIKAYSGSTIKELNNFGFAKPADLRSGERIEDFIDYTVKNPKGQRRFQDTESKIFREFEDIHLKEVMSQLGAKSANDLRIETELQTILDPCMKCQEQMVKFQAKYNAEINIFSSGSESTKKLNNLYPKYKVEDPFKK